MVVQKFGGTSVADPEAIRRLIEIVRSAQKGIVHANLAARKVSRLNGRVKALKA